MDTNKKEATAAWYGARSRAMVKIRRSKTKNIGESRPPEEKTRSKLMEIRIRVSGKRAVLVVCRKKILKAK